MFKKIMIIVSAIAMSAVFPGTAIAGTVENGWYTIQTKSSPLNRITIENANQNTNATVQKAGNNAGQKFLFTELSDGSYKIGTGTTVGSSVISANGTIYQQKYSQLPNQKWNISANSDGSYSFINVQSGKYLTYSSNKLNEKAKDNTNNQKFNLSKFADKFTVTFIDGFGTVLSRQSIKKGEAATAPANPTKSGYTFNGWDVAFNNVTKNIKVTAKWIKNVTYTVTFTDGQGKTLKTQTVNKGANATAPANPTRSGYVFNGWDKAFTNVQGNLTVNAKWSTNSFAVTFTDGQGKTLKTQTVSNGGSATAPANPTRTGYTFNGWDKDFNKITANTTVTAKWRANVLTVNYYAGTATGDSNNKWTNTANKLMQTVKYNYDGTNFATYGLPNTDGGTWKLTQTGYTPSANFLIGSATATKKINQNTKYATIQEAATAMGVDLSTGDKTINLYSEMIPKTIKVTFHKNDGTTSTYTETYTYAKANQAFGMNLTNKTGAFGTWSRSGFTLLGWSDDKNATAKRWSTYSGVTDNWINTNSPNIDIYAIWQNNSNAATDVKDGWYVIKPTLNSKYAIDVNGAVNTNKANVQLWTVNGSDAQKFYIHKIDNETWNLMTGTSGYTGSLDIVDGKANGNLQQYTYTGANAEKWKIIKNSDGSYTFYNKSTGNVLDIEGDDNLSDGKNLWDYPYLNGNDKGQSFTLTPTTEPSSLVGKKKIFFKNTNQVINISGGSVLDGANAIAYVNEELNNAKFAFEKVADGTYHIRSLVSDRYLYDNGTKVIQSRGSSNNFRWQTVWNGDGSVSFKNVGTGKFLYASSTNNSTQITTSTNKSNFTLPSTDYTQVIANGTYMIKSGSGMCLTTEYNNWNNETKIAGAKTYTDQKKGMRLFRVTYLGDGNYRFETGSSIYKSSIDMPNNVDSAGTQPQQYTTNDAAAQKFHILGLGNGNYRIAHGAAMSIQTTTDTDPCTMQTVSDNVAQKMTFTKASGWLIQDTYKYYFPDSGTKPKVGIDVSKWQGDIDWAKVKATGRVDFAIIRMLDHSSTSTTGVDAYAEKNMKSCEANGIPYGVYWYSLATNTTQLKNELDQLWKVVGNHKPTKGIWYDVEAISTYANTWGSKWQSNGTGKSNLTTMINYAKSNIESHGFEAGLYLNKAQITCVDPTTFGMKWWCPRYFTNTSSDTNLLDLNSSTYKGAYMWQWSDTYTLNGITGSRVDFDCVLYDDDYVYKNGNLEKKNNISSNTVATTNTIGSNTTSSNTTKNGWAFENNAYYYYKNGNKVTGMYKMTAADGESTEHYSYFGTDGKLVTGWFTYNSGYENLRYADSNGWVYGLCGYKENEATSPNIGVTNYSTGATGTLNGSYYFNSNGELVQVLYNNFTHLNQRSYFATTTVNYGNGCGPVSALMAANMMGKLTNYVGSTYKTASDRYSASASFRSYMTTWQESTGNTYVGRSGGSNGVWNYQIKNNLLYWHNVDAEYMEDNTMYSSDRLRGILTWGRVTIPFCNVKLDGSYAKHFMVVNGWRLNNGAVQYHVVDPYGTTKLNPNCEGQNDGWYSIDGMNSITYKGSAKTSYNDTARAVRNFTTVGTRMRFGF